MVNNKPWSMALVLVCTMALGSQSAWAQSLDGGLSVGKPSVQMPQPTSTPAAVQPVVPEVKVPQPAPQATAASPATAHTAAAAPQRAGGGMLGGLAAGLGLAWLASALGFGEGFAQVLLLVLLPAVVVGVGMWLRRRASAVPSGLAFQVVSGGGKSQLDPATPRGYSPKNVGNDASARPWESAYDEPQGGKPVGAVPWGVPADFDTEGFLKASKANFLSLQDAWDRSDMPSLRAMMTDSMLEQIQSQLAVREQSGRGLVNKTDVVMLEAHLLGIEEADVGYIASVEFSGLIREDPFAGPNPFREVWNITRAKNGSGGWLVAGVQALQ
jgi:predicted lipid-binding transport protein (Tim44 family)